MDRRFTVAALPWVLLGLVCVSLAVGQGPDAAGPVPPPEALDAAAVADAAGPPGAGGAAAPGAGAAAVGAPAESPAGDGQEWGLVQLMEASGSIGLLIILLSMAAVALVIEHLVTIRAPVLMPPGLDEEVRQLLAAGKLGAADQACQMQPSFLSFVLRAGFAEVDGGWPAVEKAMEDAAAEQSSRLFRKIEYLSVIGNIAPMLGLLGTVVGMIYAFRELAESQGAARAADLAEGIYLALVTTVEGLVVAIPALGALAVFRNRVDHLVTEVVYKVQHAVAPMKRMRGRQPRAASPPQSPPAGPLPPPVEGGF
ncbi:MAG: MotA/TolQ/ExbB proton channel family protein [Thermoguttaceae bacterium]